ncbi:MAG: hypothetical protein J6Y01_07455, partial [Spirochaetales bacterium]|nr:hypothetical protein [Spirochaetales bacterium]
TITQALIYGYGTDVVPETKTVLFDETYDYENGNYNPYVYSIENVGDSQIYGDDFCFDKDGEIYILKHTNEMTLGISLASASNQTYGIDEDNNQMNAITIDRKTNQLYGRFNDKIAKIDKPSESTQNDVTITPYYIEFGFGEGLQCFAVYDDIAYIPYGYYMDHKGLLIIDLTKATYNPVEGTYLVTQYENVMDLTPDIDCSDFTEITDILYQDGAVYMLLREAKYEWGKVYKNLCSRGAVIKYNCFDGSVKTLGWSSKEIKDTDIKNMYLYTGSGGKLYSDTNEQNHYKLSGNEPYIEDDTTYSCNSYFPMIYAPDSTNDTNDTNIFYGPTKFVGLKPKKLVIADDGLAFYTDNDALVFKNVNRVVEVDLENFALETSIPVGVSFENETSLIKSQTEFNGISITCYDSKTQTYYTGSIYLGIKNADN